MKIIAIVILTLMLFTACAGENTPGNIETTSDVQTSQETEETTVQQINSADILPDADYGGTTFTILGREYAKLGTLPSIEFTVESENGDIINDTIYFRNRLVEENLNVTIESVIGDANSLVPKSVMAGDGAYNLVWAHVGTMSSLTLSGNFENYYDVEYIDLYQPWWNQLATESLTLNGRCYLQMNYIPFTGVMLSHNLYVNKKIVDDYDLDSPYDLVDNNNWTFDEFARLIKSVSEDVDGNGTYDANDIYGLIASHGTSGAAFSVGMGIKALDIRSDGSYDLVLSNERNKTMLDKIVEVTSSQNTYLLTDYSKENDIAKQFANGGGLFYSGFLTDAYQFFRDMTDDYGLLPFPKYEASQEEYRTTVTGGTGLLAIPKSVNDLDMTGHVTEALAIESYNYVYPAVFDTVMSNKLLRDEESERMYKLIMEGLEIDFGRTFKYSNYIDIFPNLVASGSTDLTSEAQKHESAAKAHFDKIIEVYFEE